MQICLDGHMKRDEKGHYSATKWDVLIPSNTVTENVLRKISSHGGVPNTQENQIIDDVHHQSFHFGPHEDGALSRIWAVLLELS